MVRWALDVKDGAVELILRGIRANEALHCKKGCTSAELTPVGSRYAIWMVANRTIRVADAVNNKCKVFEFMVRKQLANRGISDRRLESFVAIAVGSHVPFLVAEPT